MGRSSRFLFCLSLLAATPALGQGRPVGLARAPAPALQGVRGGLHAGARLGVRPAARIGFAMRGAHAAARPRLARATTLGALQKVGLRDGRIPRLGNGFGLFGVGLGLSTAEDLAVLAPSEGVYAPQIEEGPAPLPRCIRPQIIKIGQGARRDKVRTKVVYGPATGCVP